MADADEEEQGGSSILRTASLPSLATGEISPRKLAGGGHRGGTPATWTPQALVGVRCCLTWSGIVPHA